MEGGDENFSRALQEMHVDNSESHIRQVDKPDFPEYWIQRNIPGRDCRFQPETAPPRDVLYRALAFVEEEYGDRFPRHAGAEEQVRSGTRATTERCIKT